jgi:hypothetical protein
MLKGTIFIPGQNRGTTTNDNAAAGDVGEYVTATLTSGSAITLTNNVVANVTSISLTAGDWDVRGVVDFLPALTTNVTAFVAGVSIVSAALTAPDGVIEMIYPGTVFNNASATILPVPTLRFSLASTTTAFLVVAAAFTVAGCSAYGTISARRIR